MNVAENIEILQLAHMYDFIELTVAIEQYLMGIISLETVVSILEVSKVLSLQSLMEKCLTFLDENALKILEHFSFTAFSQVNLSIYIFKNDSLAIPTYPI